MVNGVRNFMTGDSDGPVRKPSWNSSTFFLLFFSGQTVPVLPAQRADVALTSSESVGSRRMLKTPWCVGEV